MSGRVQEWAKKHGCGQLKISERYEKGMNLPSTHTGCQEPEKKPENSVDKGRKELNFTFAFYFIINIVGHGLMLSTNNTRALLKSRQRGKFP